MNKKDDLFLTNWNAIQKIRWQCAYWHHQEQGFGVGNFSAKLSETDNIFTNLEVANLHL